MVAMMMINISSSVTPGMRQCRARGAPLAAAAWLGRTGPNSEVASTTVKRSESTFAHMLHVCDAASAQDGSRTPGLPSTYATSSSSSCAETSSPVVYLNCANYVICRYPASLSA